MSSVRCSLAMMAVALLACGDSAGPDPAAHQVEDFKLEDFQVTVQALQWWDSEILLYSWSGGAASRVTVTRLSDPAEIVWEITSGSGIFSGVWHGQLPPGATADVAAATLLVPGHGDAYRVSVTLLRQGHTRSADFIASISQAPL